MLNPYTQNKLDELQSLISQRNDIDERIRALLDGGLPPAPQKAKASGRAVALWNFASEKQSASDGHILPRSRETVKLRTTWWINLEC